MANTYAFPCRYASTVQNAYFLQHFSTQFRISGKQYYFSDAESFQSIHFHRAKDRAYKSHNHLRLKKKRRKNASSGKRVEQLSGKKRLFYAEVRALQDSR